MAPRKTQVKKEELEKKIPDDDNAASTDFQPIHAVHFLELNKIWDADSRIPSAASRKAWSAARNLNPNNVHAWWYRRRVVAKKLSIKIPNDSYELEVGIPPEIPPPELELQEDVAVPDTKSDAPNTLRSESSLAPELSSEPPSSCDSDLLMDENPLFEALASEMSAYMRSSSPPCPSLALGSSSRASSPLPSSSPPPESPIQSPFLPVNSLFLPDDMMICDVTEPGYATENVISTDQPCCSAAAQGTCLSISYLPTSFVSFLDTKSRVFMDDAPTAPVTLAPSPEDWCTLPEYATYCLAGYRMTHDGFLLGLCSCPSLFSSSDSN